MVVSSRTILTDSGREIRVIEAGKRIPEDISVIGFDDMALASYFDPPLTTMRQDMLGIGRQAPKLIVKAVKSPHTQPRHFKYPAKLIVLQSTSRI